MTVTAAERCQQKPSGTYIMYIYIFLFPILWHVNFQSCAKSSIMLDQLLFRTCRQARIRPPQQVNSSYQKKNHKHQTNDVYRRPGWLQENTFNNAQFRNRLMQPLIFFNYISFECIMCQAPPRKKHICLLILIEIKD